MRFNKFLRILIIKNKRVVTEAININKQALNKAKYSDYYCSKIHIALFYISRSESFLNIKVQIVTGAVKCRIKSCM